MEPRKKSMISQRLKNRLPCVTSRGKVAAREEKPIQLNIDGNFNDNVNNGVLIQGFH